MKCFNHHDRDAFGICRVCGKGLCLECMSDNKEDGVCCKDDNHGRIKAGQTTKILLIVLIIGFLLKLIF